jgi:phosphatidylethanolamine-binding protein (PEBP) family uncharacterized protein
LNVFRWLSIFSLIFIFICPASQADEVRLGVGFSWEGITDCSDYSPEIKVANVPRETASFRVLLDDLDDPSSYHGGGKVKYDRTAVVPALASSGSGIIPAGALNNDYKGPCSSEEVHRYRFTVFAIDSFTKIVGKGKATRLFP